MVSRAKLQTFLRSHKLQSKRTKPNESNPITHTRMGHTDHNIIPGSYSIPDSESDTFHELMHDEIISNNGKEYLTEVQYKEDGGKNRCIAIDFDFNYETGSERKHTQEDIYTIICCLLTCLKKIFDFASNQEKFNLYVFERKMPYICDRKKCTKDGIHIIIGIKADNIQQTYLREKVLEELPTILSDMPLINSYNDVYDNSITLGSTNWQVYGCCKPGNEPYLLSFYYVIEWNYEDIDFISDCYQGVEFPMKEKSKQLSVRNKNIPLYAMTDEFERLYESKKNKSGTPTGRESFALKVRNVDFRHTNSTPENIKSIDDIHRALELWYESLGEDADIRYGIIKNKLKEIHDITMILPDDYADDFNRWLRVGWALYNTSSNDYMFYTWMLFSSKSSKFDIDDVLLYYSDKYWGGFKSGQSNEHGTKITAGSIIYWAREHWNKHSKNDEENKFIQITTQTVNHFIDQSIKSTTDFDLAKVLYHYCRDKFICSDVKNSCWYEFNNHRFKEIDSGVSLSLLISTNLYQLYFSRMMLMTQTLPDIDSDEEQGKLKKKNVRTLSDICLRLRDVGKKEKVMRAAKELFYDSNFANKIDTNMKLLGCVNGVVDFEQNVFRPGNTMDYITKTTKKQYIPFKDINPKIKTEINNFMQQLFPIPDLLEYMWQMLASCLVGNNKNQTFHILTGGGSNGKSLLMKLMKYVLGDYYGIVPLSIVTEKRPKIGGVSPEIMNLVGTRLAVINEPSKGDKINEGPMKALTGGGDIQGRGLFKNSVTFTPSFKLAVCTNVLFDIDATDEGTWRRIKICPFLSHFTHTPDPKNEYDFMINMDLEDNIQKWVEPFLSMLVEVAFKTGGLVKKRCDIVEAKSMEYRNNQDHIINFINEMIKEAPGEKIKKQELSREFEDWFRINYGKRNAPKMKDIYPIMDKKFGKYHNMGWHNVTIVNENMDDSEM